MGATDVPALPPSRSPGAAPRSPLSARAFGTHLLIGELIGRGGMSRVYRGWVRGTGQEVAVKVLRDDLASRPDAVHRFVRERDLLQTVASPHVVQVHDLVIHGDELGIVMDLVPGGHLRRGVTFPCELGQAAELCAQIADGLAAVHAAGVIHRDLKPENVLVEHEPDGAVRLRLTDFGISRLVDSAALTQTQITGTPGYLAPEVAAGGKVTAAGDVYALGIMLYELCTGRQPFQAENPLLLVLAHTRQEPPRPLAMPDPLWSLLSGLLAKDPGARPTAAQAGRALRALSPELAGLPPCAVPATAPVDAVAPYTVPATRAVSPSPYGTGSLGARQGLAQAPGQGLAQGPGQGTDGYGSRQGAPGRPGPAGASGRPGPPTRSTPPGSFGPPPAGPGGTGALELSVGRAGRHSDPRTGRRTGSRPTPLVIGGSVLGALVLVVVAVLGLRALTAPEDPVIDLGPKPAATPTGSTVSRATAPADTPAPAAAVPSRRVVTGQNPRPSQARTSSPAPAVPVGEGPVSSPPTSSPVQPPVEPPGRPTLDRVARTADERHSSDGHASLAIGKVAAGSGQVASITVRYTATGGLGEGRQDVPLAQDRSATDYDVTVGRLTNGTEYAFTVEVCNSDRQCTTSQPVRFTPYGAPTLEKPTLAATGPGAKLTVTVKPVNRNANPGQTVCTVTVTGTPADTDAPTRQSVKSDGDTLTFTGKAATTYVAVESCATSDVADGTATSNSLPTAAA